MAWRYVMWLITCLLRVCSALYCELSASLSCQAVSSGEAGCSCLPDGPSSTPPLCHGPSHGGSYMDEGTSHIRIGLSPHVVSGDCLVSRSHSMLSSLFACACPMSNDARVVLVCRFLYSWLVYAPLGAISLDHMYVHLHGSRYPMMDYTLRICYGPFTPWLLMFHGVPYNSFTISYCTRFAVL